MYGEQLIIFQYLPHMGELIASCRRRLSAPLEGGVVACLQLIKYLLPHMSDVKLMEQLQVWIYYVIIWRFVFVVKVYNKPSVFSSEWNNDLNCPFTFSMSGA